MTRKLYLCEQTGVRANTLTENADTLHEWNDKQRILGGTHQYWRPCHVSLAGRRPGGRRGRYRKVEW